MATKKKAKSSIFTGFERVGGGIFFLLYLLVMPLLMDYVFQGIERLMDISIETATQHAIYYYAMFGFTVVIFYRFIGKNTHWFLENINDSFAALGAGLVAFYGLNELIFRVSDLLFGGAANLNDIPISAQIDGTPRVTLLIVVILAPFIEEVLFRGYVFGGLRGHSRALAYVASCLLFAALHVWQFAGGELLDISRILLLVQYLIPGLVLAWTYDRARNLWAPILLHMAANALYVWAAW